MKQGCRGFKHTQLYIWGGSNVGKSTLVEQLTGRSNMKFMKFVFQQGVGNFSCKDSTLFFINAWYSKNLILNFFKGTFERLLEGCRSSYPVKVWARE